MNRLAMAHLPYVNEAYVELHLNEGKKGADQMMQDKKYVDLDFAESKWKWNVYNVRWFVSNLHGVWFDAAATLAVSKIFK